MFKKYTILDGQDKNTVKPRFNTDSEGAIESVHINEGLLPPPPLPRTKQTGREWGVVLSGCP